MKYGEETLWNIKYVILSMSVEVLSHPRHIKETISKKKVLRVSFRLNPSL